MGLVIFIAVVFVLYVLWKSSNHKGGEEIVLVHDSDEVDDDIDYRLYKDPPNIIRINQHPEGVGAWATIADNLRVAGVSREPTLSNVESFIEGKNRQINLERDPENAYDKNAIRVIGEWQSLKGKVFREQLGWIPKNEAERISKTQTKSELLGSVSMLFKRYGKKTPGIRINIWTAVTGTES